MAGQTALGTSSAVRAPHSFLSAAEGMSHSLRTPAQGLLLGVEVPGFVVGGVGV